MKIALSPGHTLTGRGTGAVGHINESAENREMHKLVKKWLKIGGHTVYDCVVDKADNYLVQQVNLANKQKTDVAVQIHFNSSNNPSANGTETLYKSNAGKVIAKRVNEKLATKFNNRGAKKRTDLYWLNKCTAPTILIEVCFVSSKKDCDIYNANKDAIAKLIAEGIVGHTIVQDQATNIPELKEDFKVGSFNKKVIVTADSLNVRESRGADSKKIGAFAKNTKVDVWYIDKAKDGSLWGSCSYNGKTGFIHMGYTKAL